MNDHGSELNQHTPLTGILEHIYGTARDAFFGNFLFFTTLGLILVGIEALLLQGNPALALLSLVINVVCAVPIAFIGHRIMMLNESFRPRDLSSTRVIPSRRFLKTSLPFFLLNAAIYASFIFLLSAETYLGPDIVPAFLLFPILILILFNFYFLGRFGSALPAAAIGTNPGLALAALRSKGRRWFLVQNILIGPALFGWGSNKLFAEWQRAGLSYTVWDDYGSFSLIGTIMSYLSQLVGIFALLLLVSALCQAYRSGEAILGHETP